MRKQSSEIVFEQSQPASFFYYILSGSVVVYRNESQSNVDLLTENEMIHLMKFKHQFFYEISLCKEYSEVIEKVADNASLYRFEAPTSKQNNSKLVSQLSIDESIQKNKLGLSNIAKKFDNNERTAAQQFNAIINFGNADIQELIGITKHELQEINFKLLFGKKLRMLNEVLVLVT